MGFINFIFNPFNRKIIIALSIYHVLIAFVFNWAFPFTVYTPDTPSYFFAANIKEFCGYRPYGYSAFINFCMFFYQSIYTIIIIQGFLYLTATLLFIFTIEYLFPFKNKALFYLFIVLLSLSGQAFFLNTSLMSDSVFISLSIIWVSSLLHLLTSSKNNYYLIILNLITCFLILKIRYAGLIYPVIGLLLTLIIYRKKYIKLVICLVGFCSVFLIVYQQGVSQNKTKYGVNIFSAFGGWAKLNNASVIIPEIKKETKEDEIHLVEAFQPEIKENISRKEEIVLLNAGFKDYPDSIFSTKNVLTSQLMWSLSYPEKMFYLNYIYDKYKQYGPLPCYVYCGKLYSEYADYLVKTHTSTFIRKFYLPNLLRTIHPKDEGQGYVAIKVDENIKKVCNTSFDFFASRYNIYGTIISLFDEIKYLILVIIFLLALICFTLKRHFKLLTDNRQVFFLFSFCFLIINSLFLACSIPIFLRFLVVNEVLLIASVFVFLDEFLVRAFPVHSGLNFPYLN